MIPKGRPQLGLSDLLFALFSGASRHDFENAVAAKAGARYALAFAYGHTGFYALLKALRWTQAEIILPAYTCKVMAEVIVATRNIPVFVDIDLHTYNMRLDGIEQAITPKTRGIIATHMFGYPGDTEAIRQIAGGKDILVVEDAALTFPGSTVGPGGLQGEIGLFSFGPGKPLFTLRGGVMVTNDDGLYERLLSYRDRELNRLTPKERVTRWALLIVHYLLSKRAIYGLTWRLNLSKETISRAARKQPENDVSHSLLALPGDYGTRYTDLQARIGLIQLGKSDFILARRRALARLYHTLLQDISGLVPAPLVEGASFTPYTVRLQDRDVVQFCQRMRAAGIETGRTFSYALPALKAYRPFARGQKARGHYPCAEQVGRQVVNLPMYSGLTEGQVRYIAKCVRTSCETD